MSPQTQAFVDFVKAECAKSNVQVVLEDAPKVVTNDAYQVPCSGYFCPDTPLLAVAIGKPEAEWLQILVHEFGHFLQWKEQCLAWTYYSANASVNGKTMDAWVSGEVDCTADELYKLTMASVMIESDCEKRTVTNILKYKLPIDSKEYIQKSNAYVYFYHMIARKRKWYQPGREPYSIESVWRNMPTEFADDYSFIPEHLALILEECFETRT